MQLQSSKQNKSILQFFIEPVIHDTSPGTLPVGYAYFLYLVSYSSLAGLSLNNTNKTVKIMTSWLVYLTTLFPE